MAMGWLHSWIFLSLLTIGLDNHMAEIYFGAPQKTIGMGETMEIGVFANTQGDAVNLMSGTIVLDPKRFLLHEIRDGNSFINFWIERPEKSEDGQVVFSGIIPGGYRGNDGYLFSLIVQAVQPGETVVGAANAEILLHDGEGTVAPVAVAPLTVEVVSESTGQRFVPPDDRDPPELFTPVATRDETLFDGRWYVVFGTQDKGSGIIGYDVQERRIPRPKDDAWMTAESPYPLRHQWRDAYIFVRATDRAGHDRIAMLAPRYNAFLYGILLGGAMIACLIVWGMFKRLKK